MTHQSVVDLLAATSRIDAGLAERAIEHVQARIALPLEASRDWARPDPIECKCADCRELGAFLVDPARRQWHFRAAQNRRSHVESSAIDTGCDVDLAAERRGSPHMLIATKNQASYERRTKQRKEGIEHVSALSG